MKRTGLIFLILGIAFSVKAQNTFVKQLIILNEGWYDYVNDTLMIPPSLASYDPVSGNYQVFSTIANANFGSDVVVDDAIYVAADTWLLKYDKNTLQLINSVQVPGIRKLALWQNQLLLSRGDLTPLNSYFQVYDKSTLSFLYELDTLSGPAFSAEDIVVLNDTAYLAVNNSFSWGNEKGIVGIIDLNAQSYTAEVDLGFNARNLDHMMTDGNAIYTLNNKDFTGSSISRFDINTRANITVDVAINSGCGSSALAAGNVYYMEYGVDALARYNTTTQSVLDTLFNTQAYYGLIDDPVNQQLYATATDYFSSGMCYKLQYNGAVIDSFPVGVSAGQMALDIRSTQSVNEQHNANGLMIYPNPAADLVELTFDEAPLYLSVTDISGREVYHSDQISSATVDINVSEWAQGVYLVRASGMTGMKLNVLK